MAGPVPIIIVVLAQPFVEVELTGTYTHDISITADVDFSVEFETEFEFGIDDLKNFNEATMKNKLKQVKPTIKLGNDKAPYFNGQLVVPMDIGGGSAKADVFTYVEITTIFSGVPTVIRPGVGTALELSYSDGTTKLKPSIDFTPKCVAGFIPTQFQLSKSETFTLTETVTQTVEHFMDDQTETCPLLENFLPDIGALLRKFLEALALDITLPDLSLELGIDLPKIDLPAIDLPDLNLQDVDVSFVCATGFGCQFYYMADSCKTGDDISGDVCELAAGALDVTGSSSNGECRSTGCKAHKDTNFYLNDFRRHTSITSAGQCAELCTSNSRCTHFTYSIGSHKCWLKENTPTVDLTRKQNGNDVGLHSGDCTASAQKICQLGANNAAPGVSVTGCKAYKDTDFYRNDFHRESNVASPAACAQLCIDERRCTHYTYSTSSQSCWLKKNTPQIDWAKKEDGRDVGLMSGDCSGRRCRTFNGMEFLNNEWKTLNRNSPTTPAKNQSVCEKRCKVNFDKCTHFSFKDKTCYIKKAEPLKANFVRNPSSNSGICGFAECANDETQTRTMYKFDAHADCASKSQTQTRTCFNGLWSFWSGDSNAYQHHTCQTYQKCGTTAHGSIGTAPSDNFPFYTDINDCLTRVMKARCVDGTWRHKNTNARVYKTCIATQKSVQEYGEQFMEDNNLNEGLGNAYTGLDLAALQAAYQSLQGRNMEDLSNEDKLLLEAYKQKTAETKATKQRRAF